MKDINRRRLDGITDSMDMNLGKLPDGEGQGSLVLALESLAAKVLQVRRMEKG